MLLEFVLLEFMLLEFVLLEFVLLEFVLLEFVLLKVVHLEVVLLNFVLPSGLHLILSWSFSLHPGSNICQPPDHPLSLWGFSLVDDVS